MKAKVEILPELKIVDNGEVEALKRNIHGLVQQALAMLPHIPPEVQMAVMAQNNPVQLHILSARFSISAKPNRKCSKPKRLTSFEQQAHAALAREVEIMQRRWKIATEAQGEMDKAQRDYILRQQMKAIQKEAA